MSDNESDYMMIPVGIKGGGYVGNYTVTGIVDMNRSSRYCLEHGMPLAEEANDPSQFDFIDEMEETDYEYRCEWLLPGARCYGFVGSPDKPHQCTFKRPGLLSRIKDKLVGRKRTHFHPVFCSKLIDTSVLESD